MLGQRGGLPDAVDPDHIAEAARMPGGHARKRILEDGGLRRLDTCLPRKCRCAMVVPSTRTSKYRARPVTSSTWAAFALEETTPRRNPAC